MSNGEIKTWMDRKYGRAVYEPVASKTKLAIREWLPLVQVAFINIPFEPDRGAGEYTAFAERCCIGAHADEHFRGSALTKIRQDAYATCKHHVMQAVAASIVASGAGRPVGGKLRIFQPEGCVPREYMDDTDEERPTPTVCYFLRWQWTQDPKPTPPALPAPKLAVEHPWDPRLDARQCTQQKALKPPIDI